jgi:hypothetical protein
LEGIQGDVEEVPSVKSTDTRNSPVWTDMVFGSPVLITEASANEEPGAVIPHAGICVERSGNLPSYRDG